MPKHTITIEADSDTAAWEALRCAADGLEYKVDRKDEDKGGYSIDWRCDPSHEPDSPIDPAAPSDYEAERDSNWIRHDGGECPVHPLDLVKVWFRGGELPTHGASTATILSWSHSDSNGDIVYYRHARDADGVPYVYDDGSLEPWAEYVATDYSSVVEQYGKCPVRWGINWLLRDHSAKAPNHYSNTHDHWTQTLRRVWRDGGAR